MRSWHTFIEPLTLGHRLLLMAEGFLNFRRVFDDPPIEQGAENRNKIDNSCKINTQQCCCTGGV
jgi:hypothetical protein